TSLIQSASFSEVQSHVNLTEHVRSWIYLTIAEQVWTKLSEEDQGHMMEAARRAQEFERAQFLQDEEAVRKDLETKGMTFVDVDQAAFATAAHDAVISAVDESIKPIVEKLLNR